MVFQCSYSEDPVRRSNKGRPDIEIRPIRDQECYILVERVEGFAPRAAVVNWTLGKQGCIWDRVPATRPGVPCGCMNNECKVEVNGDFQQGKKMDKTKATP